MGLEEGDLYSAWEKANNSTVLDFKAGDEVVDAKQEVWVEELPSVLMFQIKRHFFVEGDPVPIKNNSLFKFPERISPERVLWKNRNRVKQLRKAAKGYQIELKDLKLRKKTLLWPGNAKFSTLDSAKVLIDFLQTDQGKAIYSKSNVLLGNLAALHEKLEKELKEIDERQLDLESKLSSLYESLQGPEYSLHSILIHEGAAISGHYYAFIKDLDEDLWRRYSDAYVSDTSFNEVLQNSEGGGESTASAYCLIYVSNKILENSTGMSRCLFLAEENLGVQDQYSTYISENLLHRIQIQNKVDEEERESENLIPVVKMIEDMYGKRLGSIKKAVDMYSNSKNKFAFNRVLNFGSFLILNNRDELARWYVLDCLSIECYGKSLKNLADGPYKRRLMQLKQSQNLFPRTFILFPEDATLYDKLFSQYTQEATDAELAHFILSSANNFESDLCTRASFLFFQISRTSHPIIDPVRDVVYYIVLSSIQDLYTNGCRNLNLCIVKEICEFIHLMLQNIMDSKLGKEILKLLNSLSEKYKKNFGKHDEQEFVMALEVARSTEVNYKLLVEKVPEKINELQRQIEDKERHYKWKEDFGLKFVEELSHEFMMFFNQSIYRKAAKVYEKLKSNQRLDLHDIESLIN